MKILLFDKSHEIRNQIERNIKDVIEEPPIFKVNNVDELLDQASSSTFRFFIIDGDNLEGKFKLLVDTVKKSSSNVYIFLFFSFNVNSIANRFLKNGADYCFDKLCGFEAFMEIFKSTYNKHKSSQPEYNI